MPSVLWQGKQRGQPSGRLPRLRGEFADPVFVYLPSTSLFVAYPYFPGSFAGSGSVALGNGIQGNLPSAPAVAQFSDGQIEFGQRSRDLAFPNGMTILAIGSYTATGSHINSLMSRGGGGQSPGGIELDLFNQFGGTPAMVYGGHNVGGADTNWNSAWVGTSAQPSVKDSGTNGNGSFNTAINTRYAVAVTANPANATGASTSHDLSVGGFPGFDSRSWVEAVFIWDRYFSEAQLEQMASDSYSICLPERRIFLADSASGTTNTTATAATGVATVSAVGSSTAATVGAAAAGTATVSAVGAAGSQTVATAAAGAATVSAVGSSVAEMVATPADGVATVSAVGSFVADGETTAVPAEGVATVSAIGSSVSATDAVPAAGTSTVSAVGSTSGGSGASAAEIWDYVLSNGKTAGQNVVEIRAMLDTLTPGFWDFVIEGSFTAADLLRVIAAVQAGKSTITPLGGGAATVEFRAVDDSEVRVSADMTGSERTNVTITP